MLLRTLPAGSGEWLLPLGASLLLLLLLLLLLELMQLGRVGRALLSAADGLLAVLLLQHHSLLLPRRAGALLRPAGASAARRRAASGLAERLDHHLNGSRQGDLHRHACSDDGQSAAAYGRACARTTGLTHGSDRGSRLRTARDAGRAGLTGAGLVVERDLHHRHAAGHVHLARNYLLRRRRPPPAPAVSAAPIRPVGSRLRWGGAERGWSGLGRGGAG